MLSRGCARAGLVIGVILSPLWMAGQGLAADAKAPAPGAATAANLTVTQIIDKHAAARGGAQAWKAVHALQLSGQLEAGHGDSYTRSMGYVQSGNKSARKGGRPDSAAASREAPEAGKQVLLPFTLDLKRPYQSRLEVEFAGKTAVQVYDGKHGWKVRPFLNRKDVEPFTAEEVRSTEAAREDLEGPLVDSAAKGTKVELETVEAVEGHDAYKLKLTLKDGTTRHVWIDAKSFLDVKIDGVPRQMDGKMHDVYVYRRDFRKVEGVMIPFLVETAVVGYPDTHKMIIEKAAVNPKLDDALFAKPRA
jgi:hypothetical protein